MTFNPTHEFLGHPLERDLELESEYDLIDQLLAFRDKNGRAVMLSSELPDLVTRIKPKPGEVWKYVGVFADDTPDRNLVLISDECGPKFVNEEGDTIPFGGDDHLSDFVKVLNADGTPA